MRPVLISCGWMGALAFHLVVVVVVAYSSLARVMGECLSIHSVPALFSSFFLFFLKWRLVRTHLFHPLGQDQSTVAQPTEMTVAECSLTSFMSACFQIGSHTMSGQWHSQPTLTLLGQGCMRV